ncbi:polysaccharide lyase 8 family protein [Vibrio alginolyticus]|uniref:polysaccharide lyase 8 family protein n=1 Tax=Vibrio alginolyticus TaxID=663 RepID=UPI00215BAD08|nr:polysaccharide lyase 8 family protein [Vibrio alginolyticus]MCR9514149.1 polysaccharide lyase 8 family protein [Vibrio alginolyticus]
MIKPSTLSVLLSLTLVSTSNWVYADQSLSGVTTISSSQPVVHAVTADVAQEFQRLRTRWAQNFLGDPNAPFDATLQKMVVSTNNSAQKQWTAMNTGPNRQNLWDDLVLDKVTPDGQKKLGAAIRSSYQRLFTMAKAYRLRNGALAGNTHLLAAIVDGMTFLNQNYYQVGGKEWGNWWHWELAIPRDIHNTLSLIYDDVPAQLVTDHLAATSYFTPKATHLGVGPGAKYSSNPRYRESTGGNRTDNTQVVLIRGILSNNEAEVNAAISGLPPVLEYVTSHDGFYQDGSFIQHGDIAYNGTYGNVLLGGLGLQINLMAGSKWPANDPALQEIYPIIVKSYEPLLYQGMMLDFVNGRAISRNSEQDHDVGHHVMSSILYYIDGAPVQYKERLQSMIKALIQEDTYKDFFASPSNIANYQKARVIVQSSSVTPRSELIGHYNFPAMDRSVHRRPGWVFALAMHSSRLGNFECMNRENRKGWFTGDGMTYLYNGQQDHYEDYWPVVDSQYLAGTTVDNQVMQECKGQRNQIKGGRKSSMHWVGSVKLGNYGAAGMAFTNWDDTLSAKKSWFMLDEEVVMLGSDLVSSTAAPLTTVLTNRKVASKGSTSVWVNGAAWNGNSGTVTGVSSLSIRNNQLANSDLSYVFFNPTTVAMKREQRQGNWSDIGTRKGAVTGEFITALLEHGNSQSQYAYVLLPNANTQQTASYTKNPMLTVVKNDAFAHAILDKKLDLLAVNAWQDAEVKITDQLTVFNPMSVMIQPAAQATQKVSIADPTQQQTSLRLKFARPVNVVNDPHNRVQVNGLHEVVVDVSGLKGLSYQFSVR